MTCFLKSVKSNKQDKHNMKMPFEIAFYLRVSEVTPGFINISFILSSLFISFTSSRFKADGFRTRSAKILEKQIICIIIVLS